VVALDGIDGAAALGALGSAAVRLSIRINLLRNVRKAPLLVDPNQVRFSQSSIKSTFKDGGSIDELAQALKSGQVRPEDIPPIRLVKKNGRVYTLDNRRLEAFRRSGLEVPYRMATPYETAEESWKFTTKNDGASIQVRGE
jgi:hypothetical protein